MSGKRPPPSPLKQGGSVRPPPPVSAAPVVAAGVGGGLGLKIGIGLGVALLVLTVLAGGTLGVVMFFGTEEGEAIASTDKGSQSPETQKESAVNSQEKPASSSPKETVAEDAAQESNEVAPTAVPAGLPPKTSPKADADKSSPTEKFPPAATPPPPTVTSPEPGSPTTLPAATPSATVSPLDDVRQRGNFLLLPEQKITERIELARVEAAKPTDCDLSITGADELLPMGQGLKLDRADTEGKRTWTVMLKGNGALNKDRAIADFTFSERILAFQWRPGAASSPFPLHYCLLRVSVGGEVETCRMAKPVPLQPLKINPGEIASVEMGLPLGIAQKMQILRLEVTPVDFPSVQVQANQGLQAGQTANLKVTGSASGTLAPDLEIDVKFEGSGGKAVLRISSTASWPPDAKGRSMKAKVSVPLLEAKKKEIGKKITPLLTQKKRMEAEMTTLEQSETILSNTRPRTFMEQNQLMAEQAALAERMNRLQTSLDTCTAQHESATATVQWCDDMLSLFEDLESKARLGVRIYREIGSEVVDIVLPDPNAAP